MKDCKPLSPEWGAWAEKIWVTRHDEGRILDEYNSLEGLQKDKPARHYTLPDTFCGTGHVVYDGAFYFHHKGM